MIRKHIPKHSLIVISLLLVILISGFTSADVGDWVIDGNKVYVDDSKVYLSAEPHTLSDSGFVYFDINPKLYSGNVDLYFGFNSGGLKPTRGYYHNGVEWINIASHFNKVDYDYDGFDTWYYSNNLPVQAGQTYKIAVWMEQSNDISFGKYGFAIKPSFETISQAISNGHFYYLDPWWDSDWDSLSSVTMNASVPDNNFTVRLSGDDFTIPLKMWINMNQDGNDTRILHTDNATVFPIWIEHITARDNYSIWVNVTDDTTNSTLLWYYGNDNANSVSNIKTTYIIGDDFDDDSLDPQWTYAEGNTPATDDYSESGGVLQITSAVGDHVWSSPYLAAAPRIYATVDNISIEIITKITTGSFTADYLGGGIYLSEDNDDWVSVKTMYSSEFSNNLNDVEIEKQDAGVRSYSSLNFARTDPEYLKLIRNGPTFTGYVSSDGTSWTEIASKEKTTTISTIGMFIFDAGIDSFDDFRARKYIANEPVVANIQMIVATNTLPTKPAVVYPTNLSYVLSHEDIKLNMTSTDIDDETLTYYFYGDMVDGSTYLGMNDSVNSSTYNWSATQYGIYYWKVRAHDGCNYSEYSNISQFTLLMPPNLTSPSNSSTEYTTYPPLTSTILFTWQDLEAPQYRIMVAKDKNFNIMSVDTHIGTNNTAQTLLVNEEYFWRIYAYDGSTYSNSSDIFSLNLTGNSTLTGSAIEGVVYQSDGDITAIAGAEVTIWNSTWSSSMITGSNGYYVFEDLNAGTVYNLQAKSDRYWDSSIALVNAFSDPVTNNFYLIDDLTDTEWWHYVEFTVQNIWDVTYPGVATKVYIGDSPTIYDSGNTESDGTISFHLDQNIRYRITFINSTLGINEEIALYPISKSYTVYIDSYSFNLPDAVTDDIQAHITSSRINATHGYINFTYSDTSDLTTSISYYISDVDGNLLYNTSTANSDLFDSQVVAATDDRYIVRFVGVHPTHGVVDKTETIVFHGGRRVDFGWDSDWQYAVTALAFLIFIGSMFGAKTAHYGAIAVVMFAFIFKWIGWLNETNTSTLLIILAAVIAFGWSLRKSEEVKT